MAESVLNQQETKFGNQPENPNSNERLKRVLGILLSLVMIALTIFVLHQQDQNNKILSQSTTLAMSSSAHATENYMFYVAKYKVTKVELDETTRKLEAVNRQLDQVTAQLTETKSMLTESQGMLAQAQDENAKLKAELQGLGNLPSNDNAQNIADLQNKIQSLNQRDTMISSQLTDLKEQLRAFNADISSTQEGRSLILLFQNKIQLVKSHMRYLRQQAYFARVAAQKEKDRLATLNGNSGYMIKDGKVQNPDGSKKTFAINVQIVQ